MKFFASKTMRYQALGGLFLLVALIVLAQLSYVGLIASLLFVTFLALILRRDFEFGVIVHVFLFSWIGLRFIIPPIQNATALAIFPDGIDIPFPVLVGLMIFVGWLIYIGYHWVHEKRIRISFPILVPLFVFIAAIVPSVQNADNLLLSIKYIIYPIFLVYLLNVFLVVNLLRTKHLFRRALEAFWVSGFLAAIMGFMSFFVVSYVGFSRATPFSIFGVAPFGLNHNLLAETLVVTAPIGMAIAAYVKGRMRTFLIIGSVFMAAIALLTFARSAWIALIIQGILIAVMYRKHVWKYIRPMAATLLIVVPLFGLLLFYGQSPEVQGSNTSRLAMTSFSLFVFTQHPWVGGGVGTFVERLSSAEAFVVDYGEPLDAHGFAQKLLAETGIIGLTGWLFLWWWIGRGLYRTWHILPVRDKEKRLIFAMLSLSVVGAFVYQLFNTTYYTAKLWMPVGLALAAVWLFLSREERRKVL